MAVNKFILATVKQTRFNIISVQKYLTRTEVLHSLVFDVVFQRGPGFALKIKCLT